jgi:hypothetical protein
MALENRHKHEQFIINLTFTAAHPIQIRPCEVEVADAYPALGISLQELVGPLEILEFGTEGEVRMVQNDEIRRHLPAAVTEVKMWDSLGEGPDSAVRFVLETGLILIVRHQYPPMTQGLEVISQPTN